MMEEEQEKRERPPLMAPLAPGRYGVGSCNLSSLSKQLAYVRRLEAPPPQTSNPYVVLGRPPAQPPMFLWWWWWWWWWWGLFSQSASQSPGSGRTAADDELFICSVLAGERPPGHYTGQHMHHNFRKQPPPLPSTISYSHPTNHRAMEAWESRGRQGSQTPYLMCVRGVTEGHVWGSGERRRMET